MRRGISRRCVPLNFYGSLSDRHPKRHALPSDRKWGIPLFPVSDHKDEVMPSAQ